MAQVILTVGSNNRQFTTPQAAVNSITNKDLVATDVDLVIELWPDSEFVVNGRVLDIAGFTTNSTHRITVRPAPGAAYYQNANVFTNSLRYDANNGVAIQATASYVEAIRSTVPWTIIEGLQLNCSVYSGFPILLYGASSTVDRNYVTGAPRNQDTCVRISDGCFARNNIIVNRQAGSSALQISNTCEADNNTLLSIGVTGSTGLAHTATGSALMHNNAVFGFTTCASTAGTINSDTYFATDAATALGTTGNVTGLTYANQFENITSGSLNLRTKTGSGLINAGKVTSFSTSASGLSRPSGSGYDIGAWEYPSAATSISIITDGAGVEEMPETITITANGVLPGNVIVTLSDNGGGGSFNPPTVTLTSTTSSASSQYTALAAGTKSISVTNNSGGSITNPSAVALVISIGPPSGAVTSQPPPDGNNLTVTFSTTKNPTGGTATLNPSATNPAGAVALSGILTLGTNSGNAAFTDIQPGNYDLDITLSNQGGMRAITGTSPVSIIGLSGTPTVQNADGTVTIPDAPTSVQATLLASTLNLEFVNPISDGGSPVTDYEAEASTGEIFTGSSSPMIINRDELPTGVDITFTVKAINSQGPSPASLPSNVINVPVPIDKPGAPTNVSAQAGVGMAVVSFTPAASNGGSPVTLFTVRASTGQSATGTSSPIQISVPGGEPVTFTVAASNIAGEGPVSVASNPVTPVEPVEGVTVTIIPRTTTLLGGASQKFTVIVEGASQNVNLSASAGTIDDTGLFVGPPAGIISQVIVITAISEDNPSKFDTATVIIPAAAGDLPSQTPVRQYNSNITNKYGVAIEGASVTVINTDTGEKAELFADKDLTQKVFNPVITNEEGEFEFWVEATQCSYTVRGKGIETFSRENIFDIINNVDLSGINQALQNMEATKVSFVQLEAATQALAPLTLYESLQDQINNIMDSLGSLGQTHLVDVHKFVSGGAGTVESPWLGWDSAITWSENTQYDFRDGVYAFTNSPNFAKNFLKLNGKNTILKHTGAGRTMLIDAGAASTGVVVGLDINIRLLGNATSTGVLCRGVCQSKLTLDFNDVPNVCFEEIACILNDYVLKSSPVQRGRTIAPNTFLSSAKRSGIPCAGNTYKIVAENIVGTALLLNDNIHSKFSGSILYANVGVDTSVTSSYNTFENLMVTASSTQDIKDSGVRNTFSNVRSTRSASFLGNGTAIVNGLYNELVLRGQDQSVGPTLYGINGGKLDNGGIATSLNSVLNAETGKYELDQGREIKNLNVKGKTLLSADTLSVGEGQIYKTPIGQVCFGTSQPTGVARLTLSNPNNSTADINLHSQMQSLAYIGTATHIKCNTNGADVLLVSGVGNVTNQNNSYGAISDVTLKTNVVDTTPKLEALMGVRVVNYELIDGEGEKLLGVIAQELEAIFPGMVEVGPDDKKSVKYSVFVPMLIKAVQELNAKIDAK